MFPFDTANTTSAAHQHAILDRTSAVLSRFGFAFTKERLISALFGTSEGVDQVFSWADRDEAKHALATGKPHDWWIIESLDIGSSLSTSDLSCPGVVASSLQEAFAVATVESSRRLGPIPDDLQASDDGNTFQLFRNKVAYAQIRRASSYPKTVNERTAQRAASTLSGYRHAVDHAAEITKRLTRWPGLAKAGLYAQGDPEHFPCPKEWLASARILTIRLGIEDAATSMIEQLACAALGGESWNHLTGAVGGARGYPWIVFRLDVLPQDGTPTTSLSIQPDHFHAAAAVLDEAACRISETNASPSTELHYHLQMEPGLRNRIIVQGTKVFPAAGDGGPQYGERMLICALQGERTFDGDDQTHETALGLVRSLFDGNEKAPVKKLLDLMRFFG